MKNLIALIALVGLVVVQQNFAQSSSELRANTEKVYKNGKVKNVNSKVKYRSAAEQSKTSLKHLDAKLNLNTDQEARINRINLSTTKKLDALRSNRSTMRSSSYRSQVKSIYSSRDTEIQGVLDANQAANYKGMKTKLGSKRNH